MRWTIGMAALVCAGLLACGSGGDEGDGPSAAGEGGGVQPAGEVDGGGASGACPSGDQLESMTGEELRVADNGEVLGLALACVYSTDDFPIMMMAYCTDYAGLPEAQAAMTERMFGEPRPYPIGEEGLIMDDNFPDLDPPIVGRVATVRTGSQVCELQYHVEGTDEDDWPEWGDDVMEFLATESVP